VTVVVVVVVVALAVAIFGLHTAGGAGHGVAAAPPITSAIADTTTTPTTTLPVAVDVGTGPAAAVFSRIPTTDPVVFLTVDDGIVQDPAVIDYIRQQQIPVTLFPVPAFVEQNEAYFQTLHTLGASVQTHTVDHVDLTRLSAADQRAEICGPLDDYQTIFGTRPWLLRPPNGAMNPTVAVTARSCGIRAVVLWAASTNDGRLDTQGGPLQAGDIILMHFRSDLRQNLEVALNTARAAGLRPARLEDYLTPA